MRSQPSRVTIGCPVCGRQMVLRIRFPIAGQCDVKRPEVEYWRCAPGCPVDEAQLREALRI